jgi:protein-tyrosine phosphatase
VIDTHCHLLFGLDDGPRSPAETLSLARQQVAVGVTHVVCTPHFSRTFPTPLEQARERLAATRELLIGAGIALELGLAAELSPGTSVSEPIQALTERAIAGRFALVEMEPDTPAAFAAAVTERLRAEGLGVVLAHPERSRGVQRTPEALDGARAAGALVQVVAPSLAGRWGGGVASTAWELLERARVDLIASDAHRARSQPSLPNARRLVLDRYGESEWRRLTTEAPAAITAGRRPDADTALPPAE